MFFSGLIRAMEDMRAKMSQGHIDIDRSYQLRMERDREENEKREERLMETMKGLIEEHVTTPSHVRRRKRRKRSELSGLKEDPNKNRFKRYLRAFVYFELLQLHQVKAGVVESDRAEGSEGPSKRRRTESDSDRGSEDESSGEIDEDTMVRRIDRRFPALTQDQLDQYFDQDADSIVITPDNFRFDFSLPLSHEFNKDAIHVAAASFKEALAAGKYGANDLNGPLPRSFLSPKYLSESMTNHFKHLQARWREQKEEDAVQDAKRTKQARASRKTHLVNDRVETVSSSPDLAVHHDLLIRAGRNSMSDEETDYEDVRGYQIEILVKVVPDWRSEEFGDLYQEIDDRKVEEKAYRMVGSGKRRKAAGSKKILRVRKGGRKTDAHPPPPGLWINCFDEDWLKTRRPWELEKLKIIQKYYDFERHKEELPNGE